MYAYVYWLIAERNKAVAYRHNAVMKELSSLRGHVQGLEYAVNVQRRIAPDSDRGRG